MLRYESITSESELDSFMDRADGFMDSMLDQFRAVQRGQRFDLQVLVGRVQRTELVELLMPQIESFDTTSGIADDGVIASFHARPGWPPYTIRLRGLVQIEAPQVFFRWLSGTDATIAFDGPIPSPDSVPADLLQQDWRMCSQCCEAWQCRVDLVFSVCPKCSSLTWLRLDTTANSPFSSSA